MEFLQHSRRRSLLSESVYILLNIALAFAALIAVTSTNNVWVGFFIVLLGKWRVFAVRPHYWATNLMANMVDSIVSISYVVLLQASVGIQGLQIAFTLIYIAWLLLLKPQSKRKYVAMQALAAIVFGVGALMQISYDWIATLVVIGMWVIGYMSARHVLIAYREPHTPIYSMIWGLVFAELGWIFYHWTFAFDLGLGPVKLAFVTVVATVLSLLAERTYASYHYHQKIRMNDIIVPLLFSLSIITVGFVRGAQLYSSIFG